ncbi:MAG: thiamine phosphate synthase, partial [bacterium]
FTITKNDVAQRFFRVIKSNAWDTRESSDCATWPPNAKRYLYHSRAAEGVSTYPCAGVGASVHDLNEGRVSVVAGADWLVAGQVFFAGAHAEAPPHGSGWVKTLVASTSVPVIAIGGVQLKHAPALRAIGVHGVAVIRGIWDAPNAEQAASDYLSAYDAANLG